MIDVPSIIQGYAHGNFLMADDKQQLGWYSSNQRALIPLDHQFRYPKSLRRVINQNRFSVAINQDFLGVCCGCAQRETTWISSELIQIYLELNKAGWAYSFETWQDGKLAGGILGIVIRGAFIGESMFYHVPDASKVAMVKLVEHLRQRNFILFDAQMQNPHLERFGSYIIDNRKYMGLLAKALEANCDFLKM
ncbi:leucyl/phenylalanyl-tRNA--protein transferase [Cyanobacterium aponinum]|uniref:leucyl/phenylalanyl-tRNA--protein transferase n=1 Tax=Cyanobacterium aponinum TaxID=379064 RepID=UPI000C129DA1|nr:leucyl/phenylalanyl-tRNA--protein transferase [Cyanobacterium aponinum]PHV60974.1 leucyl/phenylalanyl-tRNA--protein transferase [Cyanobacterium aponinum IPPAS B-1201]